LSACDFKQRDGCLAVISLANINFTGPRFIEQGAC
jgi:hypothetical protein